MGKNKEEISKLQADAQQLVTNLEILYQRGLSFQKASHDLEELNSQMVSFIEETRNLSKESHRIIEIINKIGSSKIFEALDNIQNMSNDNYIGIISKINDIEKREKLHTIILIGGIIAIIALELLILI